MGESAEGGGGVWPPMVTLLTYPNLCIWRRREWSWLVRGKEVKPRRAREAFWRCEQALARWTRDMVMLLRVW